jgi:hypothetical protein
MLISMCKSDIPLAQEFIPCARKLRRSNVYLAVYLLLLCCPFVGVLGDNDIVMRSSTVTTDLIFKQAGVSHIVVLVLSQ